MHHMQRRKAERLYRERGQDVQEIDSTFHLGESIEHLEKLTGPVQDSSRRARTAEPKIPEIPEFVSEYYDDYLELYHTVSKLLHVEQLNLVRTKHEIGRAIFNVKQKLKESGKTTDERGHTGALSEFMRYLASELKYGRSSLYHALDFYEKYPDWDDFAETKLEVKKRGVSNKIRISGRDAKWIQVLSILYPGKHLTAPRTSNLCDYDRYGRYDCEGTAKPLKKVYHLCPTHTKMWERKLTRLEYGVGMLDEFEADEGWFEEETGASQALSG